MNPKASIVSIFFFTLLLATFYHADATTTLTVDNNQIDVVKSLKTTALFIEALLLAYILYKATSFSVAKKSTGFVFITVAFSGTLFMFFSGNALFLECAIYQVPVLGYLLLIYHCYERVLLGSSSTSVTIRHNSGPIIAIQPVPLSGSAMGFNFPQTKMGIVISTMLAVVIAAI
ncbi:hypothetical protein MDAP_000825 [Mitosporidium daphniae]|uniref:Uncharacterized protein n=1 Tax=Mitosporidium daphniae TaxID=1485682 RepID=A0A098VPX7_9MICR|nr:uncharacterized protein DI09_53p160 [Mitosporidium daphniae]KGG50844.1 hypothetical protein DI09_53p160 [Mitosporidium daphniae]|eukprot:XP_013237271.1 uncharacterized protein DI09_53p160 [Mitosporidium daphniae]